MAGLLENKIEVSAGAEWFTLLVVVSAGAKKPLV